MTKINIEIPERVKILGISGAHRKDWNTDFTLKEALRSAKKLGPWVETEMIQLTDYNIEPCDACTRCYFEATDEKMCPAHDDDMQQIYEKMLEADGIICATSVYWATPTGKMKDFMDRSLPFDTGPHSKFCGALAYKAGGAIAVGVDLHGGCETAALQLLTWMIMQGMTVVGSEMHHPCGGYFGGTVATQTGYAPGWRPDSAKTDVFGMLCAEELGTKIAELALLLKTIVPALRAWGEEQAPKYKEGPTKIDWDKYFQEYVHFPRLHGGIPRRFMTSKDAFEKFLEVMSKRRAKEYKEGLVHGKGLTDPQLIRDAWIKHHNILFVSDDQLYSYAPYFFERFVKKK